MADSIKSINESIVNFPIYMLNALGIIIFIFFMIDLLKYAKREESEISLGPLFISIFFLTSPEILIQIFYPEKNENNNPLDFSYFIYFIISFFVFIITYFTSKFCYLYFRAKKIINNNKKIIALEDSFDNIVNNISEIDNQLLENNLFLSKNKLLNEEISLLNEKIKIKLFNFNSILEKY